MTIVNIQSNEQEKKQEEETYNTGDFFMIGNKLCVLAQVAFKTYILICVENANRYTDGSLLKLEVSRNITLEEVRSICNCVAIPVKSLSIFYSL